MAAAEDTGVAELGTQIIVPKIGVGVKVDDVEVRVFLHGSPHGTQRDQMLTAQQQGELAVLQNLSSPGLNAGKGQLAGAEAELEVAAVKDVKIGQVGVLVGAVGLQPVGGTVEHDVGGAVAAVAA